MGLSSSAVFALLALQAPGSAPVPQGQEDLARVAKVIDFFTDVRPKTVPAVEALLGLKLHGPVTISGGEWVSWESSERAQSNWIGSVSYDVPAKATNIDRAGARVFMGAVNIDFSTPVCMQLSSIEDRYGASQPAVPSIHAPDDIKQQKAYAVSAHGYPVSFRVKSEDGDRICVGSIYIYGFPAY